MNNWQPKFKIMPQLPNTIRYENHGLAWIKFTNVTTGFTVAIQQGQTQNEELADGVYTVTLSTTQTGGQKPNFDPAVISFAMGPQARQRTVIASPHIRDEIDGTIGCGNF